MTVMQIICWNIRKNNAKNIKPEAIKEAVMKKINTGAPWLFSVLENAKDGDTVGDALKTALGGTWFKVIDAGGGTHTKENVVLIGGGGCVEKKSTADTTWQKTFDANNALLFMGSVAKQEVKTLESRLRDTTVQNSIEESWDASNCRNPIVVEVTTPNTSHKFGFVHSPGPQEGTTYTGKYAKTYFETIKRSLKDQNLDGLMGDFNIYGSANIDDKDGLNTPDMKLEGGTTYKPATGKLGDSRLDRVFLADRYCCHSTLGLIDGGSKVSDHAGVFVKLIDCKKRHQAINKLNILSEIALSESSSGDDNNNNNNNNDIHMTENVVVLKNPRSDEDASNIPDAKKEKN
jgi:hypothetical protein